jgi:hypothetical protein
MGGGPSTEARSRGKIEHPSKKRRKAKPKGGSIVRSAEDVQVIEELMDRRMQGGTMMYLCRWQELDNSYDSWEPAENIFCKAQIDQFEKEL